MSTSQNSWTVLESYGPPLVTPIVAGVPIAGGVLGGDVATVLTWVAEQFHQRVAPLTKGACWGYGYRAIRGQTSGFSNHASGTAIDLNATSFPMGARSMTAAQKQAFRDIAREAGVVRTGVDWSRPDEMHAEIAGSRMAVAAAAARLRSITPTPTPTPQEDIMSESEQTILAAISSLRLELLHRLDGQGDGKGVIDRLERSIKGNDAVRVELAAATASLNATIERVGK